MSHFPFQTGDSIEVHTKALFSGPSAHLVWKSNESGSNITDTVRRQRETQASVRDEARQNNGAECAVTAAAWSRTSECRWFCNEGLSGGLWVFIKMFLILIRLNLVSGHRFPRSLTGLALSGGGRRRRERKEKERKKERVRKNDRETCAFNTLLYVYVCLCISAVLLERSLFSKWGNRKYSKFTQTVWNSYIFQVLTEPVNTKVHTLWESQ